MKYTLDPNQQAAKNFGLKLGWSFNCMEMGEGKSLTALDTIASLGIKEVGIICPAYLKHNWQNEMKKFGFNFSLLDINSYASRTKFKNVQAVILDEFQYVKNPSAKRTDKVFKFLQDSPPKYMVGLSGTPMTNTALDFYPYLCFLTLRHPELRKNFPSNPYAFQEVFCRKVKNNFTPTGYAYEGVNEENKERLKDLLRAYFYFTPKHLKPKTFGGKDLQYVVGKRQKFSDLMAQALEEGRSSEYMAIKNLNSEVNTKTTIKLTNDLIEQNHRPVIFTDHRKSAQIIAEYYKTSPIIGGVSDKKRIDLLSDFDNSISTVLIGTFGAMSAGLNITSTNHTIFNDYSFKATDYDQAKKRTDRKGQTKLCYYHHVFTNDTDYKIFKKMIKKKKESDDIHGR